MADQKHPLSFVAFLLLVNLHGEHSMAKEVVPVGVVLDLNSPVGGVAERCMSMALSDFYAVNDDYNTRLALLTMDSGNDVIAAASVGQKRNNAIIGPQSSAQANPSLSPAQNPFFICTAQDDSAKVKAIAAIVKAYGWREIVLIYEDTYYGNGLIPYLMDAFEEIETRVPYRSVFPPSSNNNEIAKEIKKLNETNARIFLVHTTTSLSSKLFVLANNAGMMREGYAWIITEGLSALVDGLSSKVRDTMQDFKRRWKRNLTSSKPNVKITGLNLFGLWAYDTAWALSMAVEKDGIMHSGFLKKNASKSPSRKFHLSKGQLEPSPLKYSNPGDTTNQPAKLRIGVPAKKGFEEFVKVEWDRCTNKSIILGFSHDVVLSVLEALPFTLPYEFIPFMNKDRLTIYSLSPHEWWGISSSCERENISPKKYDAVVGDTIIVANRSLYVDFSLPYSESGVSMVVLVKDDEKNNFWIFLKPLSLDLWLTTGAAFVITGLVIWVLEHRINSEFRGPPDQQFGMIFWFSFSTLVFAHRERMVSNWSRFVMIIWFFVVLVLTQSYNASLASILILNFNESKLKPYCTSEEYHEALLKGINNGGVAAIFDEIPYIKLFLAKYCFKYTMVRPTYKTDGLGFAFPRGSSLVPHISRAILNVTQDTDKFGAIEQKDVVIKRKLILTIEESIGNFRRTHWKTVTGKKRLTNMEKETEELVIVALVLDVVDIIFPGDVDGVMLTINLLMNLLRG
ncbi:hypothetical protein CIPAW_08G038700 [Carya illinoinensis]|uniref:Ionotropic glutamate receptor C-terminal domain-containing protein n=1 Tax=Carya illinoinensis TaxID=32201 RepID=A0A8T1PRW8_CARIL|nr:hypothetical protein CIPAW_08G038700 [Carya illinoinensis]